MGKVNAHSASRRNQVDPLSHQIKIMLAEYSFGRGNGRNKGVAFDSKLRFWKEPSQGIGQGKKDYYFADIDA